MVAPTRRISLAVSYRPWAYWLGVVALAVLTGVTVQGLTKPALAASCAPPTPASLGADVRGIAIPLGEPALPLQPGDHVDVVGLAEDVIVLSVSDTAAVVAVQTADVDAVAAAVRNRTTTLALVQPRAATTVRTAKPASTR